MLTFNCHTWNKYLPAQKLVDGTCSYHSIRHADYMTKLVSQVSEYNESYIKNIKQNKLFEKMCSIDELNKDLENLIEDKINLSLNGVQLKEIIKKKNLSKNIFPVYYNKCKSEVYSNDNNIIKEIIQKKNFVITFILFKKRFSVTHWCPVIIDKKDNIVNIHVADSYNMTWWGDPRINSLINYLFPGIKKDIKCIKDNVKGDYYYVFKTLFHIIVYFCAIYMFMYAIKLKLDF